MLTVSRHLAKSPGQNGSTSRISSPTLDLVLVPLLLPVVPPQLLEARPWLRLPKKKRRKSLRKNPMTTWDSASLTKKNYLHFTLSTTVFNTKKK